MGVGASSQAQTLGMSGSCKKCIETFGFVTNKDMTGKALRTQAWNALDPNDHGQVTLKEVDIWVRSTLLTTFKPDTGEASRIFECLRPSYVNAFNDKGEEGVLTKDKLFYIFKNIYLMNISLFIKELNKDQ